MDLNQATPFGNSREPVPLYRGMVSASCYIPSRDGTRLAADIWLPGGLPPGKKIPAILTLTRYWRSMELREPWKRFLYGPEQIEPVLRKMKPLYTGRGYALVTVDVRGTGASYGVWRFPWEPVTVQDAWDIVDWIVTQDWSNGSVAGMGVSYLGTTAEMLLATGHPAIKAVVPMFNHPDSYTDISFPGGLLNQRFVNAWSEVNQDLDRNVLPEAFGVFFKLMARGVKPVGGEAGRSALLEALHMHESNGNAFAYAKDLTFRDEVHPQGGYCTDDLCVARYWDMISRGTIPVFGWGSWQDAGTADAVLRRFNTFPGIQRAVVGAWAHGGTLQASSYRKARAPARPGLLGQWLETAHFLDAVLHQNGAAELEEEKELYYYTLGRETWQRTTTWPPPGVRSERWFFGQERSLTPASPQKAGPQKAGQDRYVVDFRATTGERNRWWELGVLKLQTVTYPDLSTQPAEVLSYTTPAFEHDCELSGTPVVAIYVESSVPDCAFYVYLEDLEPGGRAHYLTEGQLRSIHRKVSEDVPPYRTQAPYHTFRRNDSLPLVPGEVGLVTFGLLPVSCWLRREHRLRLTITGHDQGTFMRIPTQETPVWNILRTPQYPSHIDLPLCVSYNEQTRNLTPDRRSFSR